MGNPTMKTRTVTIVGAPMCYFALTEDEVELLIHLGQLHYDITCKEAVNVGGVIYGWSNSPEYCKATPRELQLATKILETPPPDIKNWPVAIALQAFFRKLQLEANSTEWTTEWTRDVTL